MRRKWPKRFLFLSVCFSLTIVYCLLISVTGSVDFNYQYLKTFPDFFNVTFYYSYVLLRKIRRVTTHFGEERYHVVNNKSFAAKSDKIPQVAGNILLLFRFWGKHLHQHDVRDLSAIFLDRHYDVAAGSHDLHYARLPYI